MAKSKQGPKNKQQSKPQDPALDETLQAATGEAIDVITKYRTMIVAVIVGALGILAIVGVVQQGATAGRERLNAQWYEAFEKHDSPLSAEQLREATKVAEELIATDLGPVVVVALAAELIGSDEPGIEKSKAFDLIDRVKSAHPDDPFLAIQIARFEVVRNDLGFQPPIPAAPVEDTPAPTDGGDAAGDSSGAGDASDVQPIPESGPAAEDSATDTATSQPADGGR